MTATLHHRLHMRLNLPVTSLLALVAACSNNNIAVTATEAVQTIGTDEGDVEDGGDPADVTGSSPASTADADTSAIDETTADPGDTTADPGDTTADPADTTTADTTADPGDTTADPGDTTADLDESSTSTGTDTAQTTEADTSSGTSESGGETTEDAPPAPLQAPRYAVLDQCYGGSFHLADLDNAWSLQSPPMLPQGTGEINVGVSGEHVYKLSKINNTVLRYGFDTYAWEAYTLGPVAITSLGGFVEWVGEENICVGYLGRTEVHCYDGSEWRLIPVTAELSRYASWDRETNELYVKTHKIDGFQVIDLDTDQIVRTISGQPSNADAYHCTFDYHDGWVYFDDYPNAYRVDAHSGDVQQLPVPALDTPRGGGVNPFSGVFDMFNVKYYKVDQVIQEYDPKTNKLTLLPAPLLINNEFRVVFQQKTAE